MDERTKTGIATAAAITGLLGILAPANAADVNIASMSYGGSGYVINAVTPYATTSGFNAIYDGSDANTSNRIGGSTSSNPPESPGSFVRTWHQAVEINSIRVNLGRSNDFVSGVELYSRNLTTGAWDLQYNWSGSSSKTWFDSGALGGVMTDAVKVVSYVSNANSVNELEVYSPTAITPVTPDNIAHMSFGGTLTASRKRGGTLTNVVDGDATTFAYFYNETAAGSDSWVMRQWDRVVNISEISVSAGRNDSLQGANIDLEIWDMVNNVWRKVEDGAASPFEGFSDEPFYTDLQYGTSVAYNTPFQTDRVRVRVIDNHGANNPNGAARVRELVVLGSVAVPEPASLMIMSAAGALLLSTRGRSHGTRAPRRTE